MKTNTNRRISTNDHYITIQRPWGANAQLALDTIALRPVRGIPTWIINDMQWSHIDEITGNPPGSYEREPERVYLEFQREAGVCYIDQWIPRNPLSMSDQGFDSNTTRHATTGATEIIRDGILIDSPEAVVEHIEKVFIPGRLALRDELEKNFDAEVAQRIEKEIEVQHFLGPNILKGQYSGFFAFPTFLYSLYGFADYFMAYALYPEVIERCFSAMADFATTLNTISATAMTKGNLPLLLRLDHDMADSRGTLVDIKSLDQIWFPHFARSIKPLLGAGIRLIWHCDGNLMDMVPRLLECGLGGFQGFQYEDGMDYEQICRMKTRDGDDLFIIGGVSVTTTLPHGTPDDVREQMKWLVEYGPKVGLMLAGSSSIAPGVPLENIKTLLEGLNHYRTNGR